MLPTNPRFSNQRLGEVAHRVLDALSAENRIEGSDDTSIEMDLSLDALLFVAAGIIEADPRISTARDLREAGERAGDVVKSHVRSMRRFYEARGIHGLEAIGASLHTHRQIN